jgi:hypothetical protein
MDEFDDDFAGINFEELEQFLHNEESNNRNEELATSSQAEKRFGCCSSKEISEKLIASTPENTRKKVQWAVKMFRDWHKHRLNSTITTDGELNVFKDIDEMDPSDINFCLQKFFFDTRKRNSERYPAKTLYDIFAMLNFYFQKNLQKKFSLFKDAEFFEARKCLEAAMKETTAKGVISGTNQSKAISYEEEDILWESGILGRSNPRQLCQTLIFELGIHFCLRGGNELRRLRFGPSSQIRLDQDSNGKECLTYTEDISKCRQGGMKSLSEKAKVVHAYHNEINHDRCVVCIYKFYVSKRPKDAREDALILACNTNGKEWYRNMALGRNSLLNVVKTLTKGLPGRFTNQSLRRTGATRLFQAGIEEDLICRKTGHKSNAVRIYKEMSATQEEQLSCALYGEPKITKSIGSVTCEKRSSTFESNNEPKQRLLAAESFIRGNTFENCTINITINAKKDL